MSLDLLRALLIGVRGKPPLFCPVCGRSRSLSPLVWVVSARGWMCLSCLRVRNSQCLMISSLPLTSSAMLPLLKTTSNYSARSLSSSSYISPFVGGGLMPNPANPFVGFLVCALALAFAAALTYALGTILARFVGRLIFALSPLILRCATRFNSWLEEEPNK